MKRRTPQPSDSGLKRLTFSLKIAFWSREYSLTLTGEQLRLLQQSLESISSTELPPNILKFRQTYTRYSGSHAYASLELQTNSTPRLTVLLLVTLTNLPNRSSKTTWGTPACNEVRKDKPSYASQQEEDFYDGSVWDDGKWEGADE